MPSMVSEVSAMLVAITTLRLPGGADSNIRSRIDGQYDQFGHVWTERFHPFVEHFAGGVDLLLAGQEDQNIARRFGQVDLHDGDQRRVQIVGLRFAGVQHFDRKCASGYCENRRLVEVLGKFYRVQSGRSDNQLQLVGSSIFHRLLAQAEQHVGMYGPFVGFVEHDHRIGVQIRIQQALSQQHPVSHVFDVGVGTGAVFETDRVADLLAQTAAVLFGHTLGDRHGRHTPRLRASNLARKRETLFSQILRDLCSLAAAGFADHDQNLILAHRLHQLASELVNWQRLALFQNCHRTLGLAKRFPS
ncbi:hypothetical protein T03_17706 [Trichinella britovi]|uniref:Uncharacterized protein n=1 Tax=Trichinella britovi TaxID=45882 RepID=A0A0V1D2A0_TRIBR|nr:hypothetical protein T03_17706 [Trichinella britovi]